jgi:hypothetical protein
MIAQAAAKSKSFFAVKCGHNGSVTPDERAPFHLWSFRFLVAA